MGSATGQERGCGLKCAFCDHDESDHCKGNVAHSYHKEESRMTPTAYRTGTTICKTRHCNQIMCCCVDFLKPIFEDKRVSK